MLLKNMKLLAMYLPQFHRVKENDEWWGDGFTDWIPTRNAKPLCEGHYQPHIPLDNNYYDLLNKESLVWQSELMHKYGVDGMCFYHYYFKDGRKILEKPAELLLHNKDIDMPFCFYWANESWKRSWSNIPNANAWSTDEAFPVKSDQDGLLLNQQYGNEKDWIIHFNYLLDFFCDERYIKIDGKPLFVLYRTSLIPCLHEMVECFRNLAKQKGFPDLFIIGAYTNKNCMNSLDGALYHEPPHIISALRESGVGDSAYSITYEQAINAVLDEPLIEDKTTFFSAFTGFDDTPRRNTRGNALIDATPERFGAFLARTMAKNYVSGGDITFINAWNEWGEGMHLEPDEKYKYGFLEAVKEAKETYKNYISEYEVKLAQKKGNEGYFYLQEKADKFEYFMRVFDRWMELREKGIDIGDYFRDNSLSDVAIYGFGNFGRHLNWELNKSGIEVKYVIDRQGKSVCNELPVYLPGDELPSADIIVVTTLWIYNDIKKMYQNKYRVVSLDEIIMIYYQDR